MLSLTLLLLHSFLIHEAFLRPTPHTYLFISPFFVPSFIFLLLLGSLSVRRILLPPTPSCLIRWSWRYIPSYCMHSQCHMSPCALFLFLSSYIYITTHHSFLSSFFFFFFRPTLSPFLFITLRVRRSPLPWAHPWRVSLSRQILWLRPLPLLLLLHRELLPRLCFLYIGLVLLSRVPRLRGLVSSLLSLLRLLHLKKE